MVALHPGQHPIRTRLNRQMQILHQLWYFGVSLDQRIGEFQWVAGGVADAVDAIDCRDHADQFGQIGGAAVMGSAAVAVDILSEQCDLPNAVFGQVNDFGKHIVERTADFLATGVRHHAERAVFAAAFHDRDERGRAVDARLGQAVKFFDLGKRNVDLRFLRRARCIDHFG